MSIPDDELDATRAALAPTLQAAAAVLPLIAKAREPRFPPEKAARWQAACEHLALAWSERHGEGAARFRPAVFELCAITVELGDADCLHLSEALASATDQLEDPARREDARLLAAISATCECLHEENGLEHPAFSERARHLARRLEQSLAPPTGAATRTPTLDRIFVGEATERLDAMYEALELLPPDAYAIKTAAEDVVHLAEPLELYDIIDRARIVIARLTPRLGQHVDLDDEHTRREVLARIDVLAAAVTDIGADLDPAERRAPIVFPPRPGE